MQRSKKPDSELAKCTLTFHVVPRSSRLSIASLKQGEYKVKLTAPPVDGAANQQLIQFLARALGTSPREIEIVSGLSGRTKRILIHGLSEHKALELLNLLVC
jgi:uncharacterized protein